MGVGYRLPGRRPIPLSVAAALMAQGTPSVTADVDAALDGSRHRRGRVSRCTSATARPSRIEQWTPPSHQVPHGSRDHGRAARQVAGAVDVTTCWRPCSRRPPWSVSRLLPQLPEPSLGAHHSLRRLRSRSMVTSTKGERCRVTANPRTPERGPHGGADGGQPVLLGRQDVRQLGLRTARANASDPSRSTR